MNAHIGCRESLQLGGYADVRNQVVCRFNNFTHIVVKWYSGVLDLNRSADLKHEHVLIKPAAINLTSLENGIGNSAKPSLQYILGTMFARYF